MQRTWILFLAFFGGVGLAWFAAQAAESARRSDMERRSRHRAFAAVHESGPARGVWGREAPRVRRMGYEPAAALPSDRSEAGYAQRYFEAEEIAIPVLADEPVYATLDPAAVAGAGEVLTAARATALSYLAGRHDDAERLVHETPGLVAWEEAAGDGVAVTCSFERGWDNGRLRLQVERFAGTARQPLAVCFPAGTYAAPISSRAAQATGDRTLVAAAAERDLEQGTPAIHSQDLALTRAPVVYLAAGQRRATVDVPVACASFRNGAPHDGERFVLDRFPHGSPADRLAAVLCAGSRAPEAEAQLALWIARNDIDRAELAPHVGDVVTFESRIPIAFRHAGGAARLLARAAIPLEGRAFFAGSRPEALPERPARPRASTMPREPAPRAVPRPAVDANPNLS